MERRLPIGADPQEGGGVHFRVWAPESRSVAVELHDSKGPSGQFFHLNGELGGYFSGLVKEARVGSLYKYRVDAGSFPDPASRFQPGGPHGPSQVIDPRGFKWTDTSWKGVPKDQLVIYEMHIGTFTPEGTWAAAMEQLRELKRIGVTMLEIMPIAEFPGEFGWGYDGVDLFAPSRLYGTPEDAQRFINLAHELDLMVILDVVYNHVGPDGNFLPRFSRDYFSSNYACEWGEAINFDGENSAAVREFFISNARYWIEEFHFDGLRLDATQQIFDKGKVHILSEISRAAREAGKGRQIYIVGENEVQECKLVRAYEKGGYGIDSLWNDDYHHAAMVAAIGKAEAYYSDFKGSPQEFISSVKYGFLFQGQLYYWQKKRRGKPALDLNALNFVTFLQNHDQVANSLRGLRLHELTSSGKLRALTALTLLIPSTPMLFMGQEFAASQPFLFFADHNPELNRLVSQGRSEFLSQFRSVTTRECRDLFVEPAKKGTFERCKLDFSERETNKDIYQLHIDLLQLRHANRNIRDPFKIDGAVLSSEAFVLRYFGRKDEDHILIVNLGADLYLNPAPEPLLAPLEGKGWKIVFSTENPCYGGCGTPPLETAANWIIPAEAAVLLSPDENSDLPTAKLTQND